MLHRCYNEEEEEEEERSSSQHPANIIGCSLFLLFFIPRSLICPGLLLEAELPRETNAFRGYRIMSSHELVMAPQDRSRYKTTWFWFNRGVGRPNWFTFRSVSRPSYFLKPLPIPLDMHYKVPLYRLNEIRTQIEKGLKIFRY